MESSIKSGGVSLTTVIFIVFLILKLCNVITWSWWLVCLPIIIPFGLIVIGFLFLGIAKYIEESDNN